MRTVIIKNGTYLNENHFEDFENCLSAKTLTLEGRNEVHYQCAVVLGSEWIQTNEGDLIEDMGTHYDYWSVQTIKCDDDGYLREVQIDC